MELLGDLVLIASIQRIIYVLIMICRLLILCRHRRRLLISIHDVGHVEHILRCQPVIQNQQLLIFRLCAGIVDDLDGFIALFAYNVAVVLHAQLVAVHKGHNGTGQIVIGVVAVSDIFYRLIGKNQHLAQNAETILALVVVLHVERQLCTKDICICLPVVLILLEHIQYRLLLIRSQLLLGFGSVCLGRLYANIFQFLLNRLDRRIGGINLCIFSGICNHRCIDVRLIQAERNLCVTHGDRAACGDLLLSSSLFCLCTRSLRRRGGLVCCLLRSCIGRQCRHAHEYRQAQTQNSFELLIHHFFSIFVRKYECALLSSYISLA